MSAEETPSEGAPEWMVSYADMITIMMAFFVVMYAMAGAKDTKKQQPVMNSLNRQFGRYVPGPSSFLPNHLSAAMMASGEGQKTHGSDGQQKKKSTAGDAVRVTTVRAGDQLTSGGAITFDGDAVNLSDAQKHTLSAAAQALAGKPQLVEIRGHTAPRAPPSGSGFRDHWDLAYARCHATMEYLVSEGIELKRIRISVAADNEPVEAADGATAGHRNSRVEVFMLNEFAEKTPTEKTVNPKLKDEN